LETCIASVSVAGTLREKISAIASAGFDALELYEPDLATAVENPRDIAAMVTDRGLRLALLQPLRDFEGLPEPRRSQAFDAARRMFDTMAGLGTDLLLVCSSVAQEADGDLTRIVEDISSLGEVASSYGMRIGFEALSWARHIRDHRQAWDVVKRCNHPSIGLVLDSFQTLVSGSGLASLSEIDGARVFHVQVADASNLDSDLLLLSRRHRQLPGEGNLDLDGFMTALRRSGYDGPCSVELFRELPQQLPAPAESLRTLRTLIDHSLGK